MLNINVKHLDPVCCVEYKFELSGATFLLWHITSFCLVYSVLFEDL